MKKMTDVQIRTGSPSGRALSSALISATRAKQIHRVFLRWARSRLAARCAHPGVASSCYDADEENPEHLTNR